MGKKDPSVAFCNDRTNVPNYWGTKIMLQGTQQRKPSWVIPTQFILSAIETFNTFPKKPRFLRKDQITNGILFCVTEIICKYTYDV